MYNLDFAAAHTTFQTWQKTHPDDPVGFASDAAAYLFSELDRLHVLQLQLFTDDERFNSRSKLTPDPAIKASFERDLNRAEDLAHRTLEKSPDDAEATFALILANGLRGDYLALIEKKNFASLSYMKNSRVVAERLLAKHPQCYDAYLAVGAENYILSLSPAPVRWLLRIAGAQTDREEGISRLRLAAQKGDYLAPYARLLLAVAALRDNDPATARRLLQGLADEFPKNDLYAKELARIPH